MTLGDGATSASVRKHHEGCSLSVARVWYIYATSIHWVSCAMIDHLKYGTRMPPSIWNEVEAALGLPLSSNGRPARDAWDAIAHHYNLPDTEQLKQGVESPGIFVLPHWLWNRAVDIANRASS